MTAINDLAEGESVEMKGSASKPYILKNDGGIYPCTCPAWRNQSLPIDKRTCKHLKKYRGEEAEIERIGTDSPSLRMVTTPVGGDVSAPPVMLADRWVHGEHDPTGWWASEKLDGVRAWWDGKQFLSRLGNRFVAPDWFVEGLPDHPLDGELWGGRKRFQETVSIVRSVSAGDRWRDLAFVVFDAPEHGGRFEERMVDLVRLLDREEVPFARTLPHEQCAGIEHLRSELARIEALGGEGLMLREPGSSYVSGRSTTLLKVKSFFDDEAVVVEHLAGAGKHRGRLGAVVVERPDGLRFSVGTGFTDAQREAPPPVGTVITYRYQELTKAGVPRFPSFVGLRGELDVRPMAVPAVMAAPAAAAAAVAAPAAKPKATKPKATKPKAAKPEAAAPAPVPAAPASAAPQAPSAPRRFEFTADGSSKFWSVHRDGASFTVSYGRIGTSGQSKTKELASEAAAAAEVEKLVAEKIGKGYAEVQGA